MPRKKPAALIPAPTKPVCCDLCGRAKPLTRHHLIPRGVHRKQRFVTRFGKQEMRQRLLLLCKECHNGLHDLIPDERELAERYSSREALLANAAVQKHVAWVRKQK